VNSWVGIGNLTKDPEMRYTPDGKAVTSFSIAINNGRDRDGNERPPYYFDIVCWEKLAESTAEYLRKGKKCAVMGQLTYEDYPDRDGNKRRSYRVRANNVEFLSPRDEGGGDEPRRSARRDHREPEDNFDGMPF
jgi:single-strand DNA-binding protein